MRAAVWTLGAEADVQRLYERLETWEEGTGDRFYEEVLSSVRLLEVFPRIGPVVHRGNVRRVLVSNRNYGLFYVSEPRGIVLHALFDLRQDPKAIMKRLREI
ncbi:MAG: type II toxin-antitoxin system RelE/ParE family toxin [Verrucomicrobiaceae bacterium]|nr:type II toxin-antitoxin system RelE/ParE family toxin [Verrucomicrobiaceae bacterium]